MYIKTSKTIIAIGLLIFCHLNTVKCSNDNQIKIKGIDTEHNSEEIVEKEDNNKKKNTSHVPWFIYSLPVGNTLHELHPYGNPNHGLLWGIIFSSFAGFLWLDLWLTKKANELLKEKSLALIEKENPFIFVKAKQISEDAQFINEQAQESKNDAILATIVGFTCIALSHYGTKILWHKNKF